MKNFIKTLWENVVSQLTLDLTDVGKKEGYVEHTLSTYRHSCRGFGILSEWAANQEASRTSICEEGIDFCNPTTPDNTLVFSRLVYHLLISLLRYQHMVYYDISSTMI
jgi:hypothetical protein